MSAVTAPLTGRLRGLRRRRWSQRTLTAGAVALALIVVPSLLLPLFAFGDPTKQDYGAILQAPSLAHPFGTDPLGRDIFSRVLSAVALDVRVALLLTVAVMVLGVLLGVLAGYGRGGLDTAIMRVADVLIAFPFLILVIVLAAVFGPGLTGIYVAVIGTQWTIFARLTRAEMLVLRELDFMRAAETLGYSRARILLRHALPNVVGPALALAPAQVVGNVLYLATLSYLGLGVQPPQAELGASIAEGQQYLESAWWMATLPGLVLVALGVAFSLVGDGLAARLGKEEVPLA